MSTPAPAIPASNSLATETLSISGMHCAGCVARVEGAAAKVPGVAEIAVNLAAESGRVTYNPAQTSAEAIARAVTEFGYPTTVVVDRAAQEAEHRLLKAKEAAALTRKVTVSGVLSALILALSHSELLGLRLLDPTTSGWVQFAVTLPVQLWAGAEFYVGSWHALRNRTTDMNVLIMLGTTAAFAFSTLALLAPHLVSFPGQHGHHVYYFESAAVIITLVLTGRLLELRAKSQTNAAIRSLMQLQAPTADRVNADGSVTTIALELVHVGDRLRVVPGAQVPVDGRIIEGTSALDESLLTGESMPQERGPGDAVIGGSLNTTGSLLIEATQVGEGTLLAKIIRLVEEAQGSKAPIQRLADHIAAIFVPVVLVVAALTAILWLLFGAQLVPADQVTATALATTMAVLIIACPCALGLATPTAIMVGTGVGARRGVLIRNGAALEQLQRVTVVVLDKTGTLTQGHPVMVSLELLHEADAAIHGPAIAAIEARSEHPLARALVAGLAERGILPSTSTIDSWDSIPGGGVRASIDGPTYLIGNLMLLEREGLDAADSRSSVDAIAQSGATPVVIAVDGAIIAVAGFADPLKDEAPALIDALQHRRIRAVLATGDHPSVAKAIAARAGITEVHPALLPAEKQALIARLQSEGEVVAMLGDGVNDAPALAQADIGVAMGTGTAVALESASVTLLRGQLGSFLEALDLSSATLRTIRQNLFWAFAYNVIGIPLAAGLYHVLLGWPFLNPMFAAAAMALSSVTVLSNSLRLRGWNPKRA